MGRKSPLTASGIAQGMIDKINEHLKSLDKLVNEGIWITKKEKKVGTVVAKKCGCCGHHEIGVENEAGQYHPLIEGMKVEIIEED